MSGSHRQGWVMLTIREVQRLPLMARIFLSSCLRFDRHKSQRYWGHLPSFSGGRRFPVLNRQSTCAYREVRLSLVTLSSATAKPTSLPFAVHLAPAIPKNSAISPEILPFFPEFLRYICAACTYAPEMSDHRDPATYVLTAKCGPLVSQGQLTRSITLKLARGLNCYTGQKTMFKLRLLLFRLC